MTIKLAVINKSTVLQDSIVQVMLPPLQRQWNEDLASVWSVEDVMISFMNTQPPDDAWWLVFLDDSDQANALAYHDLTNAGLPLSKVFVKTIQVDHASLGGATSHELVEMAVNPWLNSAYMDTTGQFWAGEVADPVEGEKYGYSIDGVFVSDFVTPDWFAHVHSTKPVDYKGHLSKPFEIGEAGYAQVYGKDGWEQINGGRLSLHAQNIAQGSRRWRMQYLARIRPLQPSRATFP